MATRRRGERRGVVVFLVLFAAATGGGASRMKGAEVVSPALIEAAQTPSQSIAPTPRLIGASSGRFAVIAEPGVDGVRLAELAEAAWREWREPLGLPSRLPSAITVRLVPDSLWAFGASWSRVMAEPGGVVSVWVRGGGAVGMERERRWLTALAEGALRRKTFLSGADQGRATVPAWLAAGAAEAVIVAGRPAMLDAWQAAMRANEKPARLRDVLLWDGGRDGMASETTVRAAHGVWLWLRDEGGRSKEWTRFLAALLRGESPGAALAREFARLTPRPTEAREWELAWRVAAARLARARVTPVMEPAETRRWLEALARIVSLDTRTNAERALPAWGEWLTRREAWPRAERGERARLIAVEFSRLHPFYRNAAGSLGRAWVALAEENEDAWRDASGEWAQDLAAGRTLEDASTSLLDEAERGRDFTGRPEAGR